MATSKKKQSAQQPPDAVDDTAAILSDALHTALNELLSQDTSSAGKESIQDWLSVSKKDVLGAVKKQRDNGDETAAVSSYRTLITKLAKKLKKRMPKVSTLESIGELLLQQHAGIKKILKAFLAAHSPPGKTSEDDAELEPPVDQLYLEPSAGGATKKRGGNGKKRKELQDKEEAVVEAVTKNKGKRRNSKADINDTDPASRKRSKREHETVPTEENEMPEDVGEQNVMEDMDTTLPLEGRNLNPGGDAAAKKGKKGKALRGRKDSIEGAGPKAKGKKSKSEPSLKDGEFTSKKKSKQEQEAEPAEEKNGLEDRNELERIFIEQLPDGVKKYFREVGFAKWSKDWVPVICLSPYDVPDPFRKEWMQYYERHIEKKAPMHHLVVWYGTKNPSEMYGWVTDFLPYEKAMAKNFHVLPKRLVNKMKQGKDLSVPEQNIVDAFNEVELALALSKAERWARLGEEMSEPIQSEDDTGETGEDEEAQSVSNNSEQEVSPQPLKKGRPDAKIEIPKSRNGDVVEKEWSEKDKGKNKGRGGPVVNNDFFDADMSPQESEEDDVSHRDAAPAKKRKSDSLGEREDETELGRRRLKKSTDKPKKRPVKGRTVSTDGPVVNDDIFDADIVEGMEENDASYRDTAAPVKKRKSDSQDEREDGTELERRRLKKSRDEPKKGSVKGRAGSEPKMVKEKTPKELIAQEKKQFYQNEVDFFPVMRELKAAIRNQDLNAAQESLIKIDHLVPSITPSFIQEHGIGQLIREMRKAFEGNSAEVKERTKAVTSKLKDEYGAKMALLPEGFKVTWKASRFAYDEDDNQEVEEIRPVVESAPSSPKQIAPATPAPFVAQQESAAVDVAVPRKAGSTSDTKPPGATARPITEVKAVAAPKPKKPKFSLGAMIDGTVQGAAATTTTTQTAREQKSASALSAEPAKKGPPTWLTDPLPDDTPEITDSTRLLGREFIDAIYEVWPNDVLEKVNLTSFVHNMEQAIYDWSQEQQTPVSRLSRPVKALKYPDNYWVKIRDVVSGLTGRNVNHAPDYKPKLVEWMMRGDYATPMDLVKLPGITFYESMKNLL